MGVLGSSFSSYLVAVTIVLGLVLNSAVLCYGGTTSNYTRTTFPTYNNTDMPVDSEAFYVPPGKNTPQQVCFSLSLLVICSSPILVLES